MKSTGIIVILLLLYFTHFQLFAQNLVEGGDFENGMGTWYPWFVDENASWADPPYADASFYVAQPGLGGSINALYVDIFEPGQSDWYILVSKSVPFELDNMYELYLRASAEKNRTISFGVFEDISSGSPFVTQVIDITQEDKLYGPFRFLYEPVPVNPGIKIQFGGMEGGVVIDDVSISKITDNSDYNPSNSLEDIIGDVTLPHEGLPHGVPDSYDWARAPRSGAQRPPEGWTAAIAWGQLYEWAEGNPATNTRVQIRDMEMHYLSKSDNQWHQLQKSLRVDGAAYTEDFVDNINKPADIRSESDGSISVTAGNGYNFHFWPSAGRVEIPKDQVDGCFISVQCRLILDNPEGPDDRDQARYLMSVGGDWWESLTAQWDNWTTNADMGIGRFRFITSEWKGYNMISLPEEQVRENPPPFSSSTKIIDSASSLANNFRLKKNYPNPFNSATTIEYKIPLPFHLQISVYNFNGQLIKTLINEKQTTGNHLIRWDGRDNFNTQVASGIYIVRMMSGDFYKDIKITLIR